MGSMMTAAGERMIRAWTRAAYYVLETDAWEHEIVRTLLLGGEILPEDLEMAAAIEAVHATDMTAVRHALARVSPTWTHHGSADHIGSTTGAGSGTTPAASCSADGAAAGDTDGVGPI